MAEYIEREALKEHLMSYAGMFTDELGFVVNLQAVLSGVDFQPSAEVVEVTSGYHVGDVCIYGFGHENKSRAIVEIVKILNDERGVAEVKFHKVFVDDTGNWYFNYLVKSGNTMNASFQYLKNITPRMDGE